MHIIFPLRIVFLAKPQFVSWTVQLLRLVDSILFAVHPHVWHGTPKTVIETTQFTIFPLLFTIREGKREKSIKNLSVQPKVMLFWPKMLTKWSVEAQRRWSHKSSMRTSVADERHSTWRLEMINSRTRHSQSLPAEAWPLKLFKYFSMPL